MIDLKKIPEDENDFYKYLWRVGTAIEDGTAGCSWDEATPTINAEWGKNFTACTYRKPVQGTIPFYEHVFLKSEGDASGKDLASRMDELYKLKRQLFDQRREYNKLLTAEARAENLHDIIREAAERLSSEQLTPIKDFEVSDDEAVLCLADWHYGMKTNNLWNKFDISVCKHRVSELVARAITAIKTHKVKRLHVLCLGDFAHGACHVGCRVASEEFVCEQLMQVTELLSEVIEELAGYVEFTDVYSTFGNHMRTIQKKEDSIHDDNMEKIIPWFLSERFKNREDIAVHISDYNDIVIFDCCGYGIFASHGDIDKFDDVATTASILSNKALNKNVDYAIVGDKHSLKEYDKYGVKVIQSSCLCGTDEYAHNHRLYSAPGQLMLIFDKPFGRKCTYDITFTS